MASNQQKLSNNSDEEPSEACLTLGFFPLGGSRPFTQSAAAYPAQMPRPPRIKTGMAPNMLVT